MRLQVKVPLAVCLAVAALASPARAAETVYSNAFDSSVPTEWAASGVSPLQVEPEGSGNWFLGRFYGDIFDLVEGRGTLDNRTDVTLKLASLPPHRTVTVAFDVFVVASWDGNSVYDRYGGPDRFEVAAVGGPSLLSTTFSLCDPSTQTQAYPDDVPAAHPPATGAVAVNSLSLGSNYMCPTGYANAVFHVERTFAHSASDVALQFSGVGLQWWYDESWGLDNVTVSVDGAVSWSGVMAPFAASGTSFFKVGTTVPVKFVLTGASAGVTDLPATLSVARIVGGQVLPASGAGAFRYDAATGKYVLNWSTSGLAAGTYRLFVDLADGATHPVDVTLR